jgi:4-amino-4-deoxy-L-arabinose transferase-like glycosyltransferase
VADGTISRYRVATALILTAALAARLAYVLLTPRYVPLHDDRAFDRLALGVARTGAYPDVGGHATAYRPPGFTYILGGLYRLTGSGHARIVAARFFQTAVGTGIVAALGAVAGRLFGRRAALCTMGVAAVYPPLIGVGAALLSEPETVLLELGAVLAVLGWRSDRRWRWVVGAGGAAGVLALTRSNAFVVIPALAAGLFARSDGRSRLSGLRAPALMVAVTVAVVAPWTLRNAVVMRSFIPVSDELGGTLAGTYNPVSAHDRAAPAFWHLLNQIPPYVRATRALSRGPEPAFQSRLLHLALNYFGAHPLYPFTVAWYNTLRIADLTGQVAARYGASLAGITSPLFADLCVYAIWVVLVLAAAGLVLGPVRRAVPGFVWAAAGLLFLSVVLVNGESPRLRIPIDPFLLLLAGAVLAQMSRRAAPPIEARLRRRHTSGCGEGKQPHGAAGRHA